MTTEFIDANLRGARFIRTDLSGAVMRAVDINGADIDAPWLLEDGGSLIVNGVDVAPFIDAELNQRFPGRAMRRASDPAGLREAWQLLQTAWGETLGHVSTLTAGAADISVAGEWSCAQTLRHLVMATDTWLGRTILGLAQPYHRLGQPHAEYETDGYDMSVFTTEVPSYEQVLEARAERVAMVRDFLAATTPQQLTDLHNAPWSPSHQVTTCECLHVILDEEWEHLRFARRDLAIIEELV